MVGATAVFVRGFDYGTTQVQLQNHCSQVGSVTAMNFNKDGSAVVTFSSPAEASAAVASLNKSTIAGNSRFIDVQIDKNSLAPKSFSSKIGVKRPASGSGGGGCVFVRGFDFGTTDEQLESHMSTVGTLENVQWVTQGSAEVTYSSAQEAAAAVAQLHQSTIEGNSRFIDVMPKDASGGERPAKRFNAGAAGPADWIFQALGLSPPAPLSGGGRKSDALRQRKGGPDHKETDPAGSGRVFVRGFDFGTSDAQLEGHMKTVGAIHTVHWVSKGSAVVVYKKSVMAAKAVSQLNQTTLEGNSRYIEVILN